MKENATLVLSLLNEGHNVNEIQDMLKINNREFSVILKAIKDAGYNFYKTISSDGTITIKLNKNLNFNEHKTIRINVKDRVLRAIFISDLHIGSIYERPELLKKVYQYAKEHNIHIIFNCGDLIENVYPDNPRPLINKTAESQLRKVVRIHPFDHSIICINLYGNHDYRSVLDEGLDVGRYIEERRYDLISLGYGECIIRLKDDAISIIHDLKKTSKNVVPNNVTAIYRGHSHKSKTRDNKIIYVPSLSENDNQSYEFRPLVGFLDVEFIFFDKKIARENIKQLAIVGSEIRLANEETMIINPNYKERSEKQRKLTKSNKNTQGNL